MGQIKTGPSGSAPHRVQAEYEPQSQAIILLHEPTVGATTPTQNEQSVAAIYQNQRGLSANDLLTPQLAQQQLEQQRYQPQTNLAYEVPPPAAPAQGAQFPPQSSQNTEVVYTTGLNHLVEYPPQSRQSITIQPGLLPPQGPQTHVMMHSNEPNQHAIYQQQEGPRPQAIYQQPPPSYPQNIAQPFVSNCASHSQTFYEASYQVPPQYVVMPPYIHGTVSQVTAASGVLLPVEGWKTGLFDCMDDPMNALITVCFPCVTFGQVAEIADEGHTSCATSGLLYGLIAFLIGVPCILSCTYRTKLRNKFGLEESPAPDWVTHCLCDFCALCQEYRELQRRGWDPSIGWHGNLAKRQSMQQQQHLVMMPPINQTMIG
ncbi:uncharacterized protein LOC111303062 [Durio zibethinus]|uniref:Uncharacterized protein LOC111303062 n=1 Tax=Durio zibethinus TaxID=66656 RepID=A0A6P5ZQZ4_DURZI|nr:uncharacterized protein LOC111303062 [Durio zibethinus]